MFKGQKIDIDEDAAAENITNIINEQRKNLA